MFADIYFYKSIGKFHFINKNKAKRESNAVYIKKSINNLEGKNKKKKRLTFQKKNRQFPKEETKTANKLMKNTDPLSDILYIKEKIFLLKIF